jgi:serine/threonine-protein kinase
MDFGISKALEAGTQYTSTGQMLGTPRYVSPEQALGDTIDGRSDQYSLAVVGYQMLTGRLPLTGDSAHVLMFKHVHEMPPPARTVRQDIPVALSNALQRALAKAPEQRFGSMAEFAAAISPERRAANAHAASPASSADSTVRSGTGLGSAVTRVKRFRGRTAGFALAAAVLAAGMALGVGTLRRDAAPRQAPSVLPVIAPTSRPPPPAPPVDSTVTPAPTPATGARGIDSAPHPAQKPSSAHKPRTEHANVSPRASRDSAVTRTPLASGFLTVNAVPYGSVSIDGVEVGDTPIVRRELAPGEHTIRITRDGFRPDSAVVTITARNEVRLSRSLVKVGP